MKEEALELADFLEKNMVASVAILGDVTATYIVSTIRRLVEELDATEKAYKWTEIARNAPTKPLSDEEIQNIWYQHEKWLATVPLSFARAIEERHGIK